MSLAREERKFSLWQKVLGEHTSKLFRMANQQVMKALRYGYVGRKRKKERF